MLRFESVFWATQNRELLLEKLENLGFNISESRRDPAAKSIAFGPEAIEVYEPQDEISTLTDQSDLKSFLKVGEGIFGIGLESDHITLDYQRFHKMTAQLEKPRKAKDAKKDVPLWLGFNLPSDIAPALKAWVVMNSPEILQEQAHTELPMIHPNTCFGIEAVHLFVKNPEEVGEKWSAIVEKPLSGLQWNEMGKTHGKRLQAGNRFFDILALNPELSSQKAEREGVSMFHHQSDGSRTGPKNL